MKPYDTTYWAGTDEQRYTYPDVPPERPVGVSILAVLNFIGAAIFGFIAVSGLFESAARREIGLLMLLGGLAALEFTVALGLWRQRMWARVLGIVLYGLSALSTICTSLSDKLTLGSLIGFAIPVIACIYLCIPSVGESFQE